MENQAQKPERVFTIIDSPKLRITAPNPNLPTKNASFKTTIYEGNPGFVVNTGDPAEQQNPELRGAIRANFEPITFYAILDCITECCNTTGEYHRVFSYKTRGQNNPEPIHVSDLIIFKDQEGVPSISIIDRKRSDRVKIKFNFSASDPKFHPIKHKDGNSLTKQELSIMYGKAYVEFLKNVMPILIKESYVHKVWTPNKNKGNYNNNNRNSGGGNNWQQRQPQQNNDFNADDIPL